RRLCSSSSKTRASASVEAVTRFTRTCSSVDERRFDIAIRTIRKANEIRAARIPIAPSTRIAMGVASRDSMKRAYPRRSPVCPVVEAGVSALADKKRGDRRGQVVRVERLGDERRGARLAGLVLVVLGCECRDNDALSLPKHRVVGEAAHDVEPGTAGHHHVD